MGFFSFFSKEKKETLDKGLSKTKESVFGKIARAVAGKSKVDDEVLDNLEEVLITSDVGVETTLKIIKRIEKRVAQDKYVNTQELNNILREEIAALLTENNTVDSEEFTVPEGKKPYVIMVVGVNGVGKTTTIGKLAYQFKKAGKSVYLGAADTFRAAAVEQLVIWGERVGVPVIKQKMGSDPASVAFDTLSSAVANNADVVIIDTAGRLHNKIGLMNELTKIKNVMQKVVPDAPHEILLVLDGSTGQNAFEQAKQFTLATEVNAMAITKLDGTKENSYLINYDLQTDKWENLSEKLEVNINSMFTIFNDKLIFANGSKVYECDFNGENQKKILDCSDLIAGYQYYTPFTNDGENLIISAANDDNEADKLIFCDKSYNDKNNTENADEIYTFE